MKKGMFFTTGLVFGMFFLASLANATQATEANLASALTRIQMAMARAEEAIKQGGILRDRLEKTIDMNQGTEEKAGEVLTRTSIEERMARRALLADPEKETPVTIAKDIDERQIKFSQIGGIKAKIHAGWAMEKAEEALALIDEAIWLSEEVLAQAEIAMKDTDTAISQVEIIDRLADEAMAMIREASIQERGIDKEASIAADEAAKADYYSRYREKEVEEEDIFELAEMVEVPLIRTREIMPPGVRPTRAWEHTVVKGDTLWDIAGHYYKNPFEWPRIYRANKEEIEDPHWIYPGEVFTIPEAE